MKKDKDRLFDKIEHLLNERGRLVIAIDGRCGSGKTTLAKELHRRFGARAIHMDDFFLPANERTLQRMAQPGGNIHTERLIQEVMSRLTDTHLCYNAYRCQDGSYEKTVLPTSKLTVVEGTYSLLPRLREYYDLKIFCDVSEAEQKRRVQLRNKDNAPIFFEKWIPMEEGYFNSLGIREVCDIILDMEKD